MRDVEHACLTRMTVSNPDDNTFIDDIRNEIRGTYRAYGFVSKPVCHRHRQKSIRSAVQSTVKIAANSWNESIVTVRELFAGIETSRDGITQSQRSPHSRLQTVYQ